MNRRTLIESILSLTFIQAANFIVPLLAIPFLTRILEPEAWGKVSYVLFVMQFLLVLTDFGFSLSAVRRIAQIQGHKQKVSKVFSACWAIQWLILIAILALAIVCILAFDLGPEYFIGLSLVIGNVLFPIWLFQGLENLKLPAATQLVSRIVMLALIITTVETPQDAPQAIFFLAGHNILAGPILLAWVLGSKRLVLVVPSYNDIVFNLRDGYGIFCSKLFISSYTSVIPIVLGISAGSESVGMYYVADKIRVAASYVLTPLSLALFPRASHLLSQNVSVGMQLILKLSKFIVLISLVFSMLLFVFADEFIFFASGSELAEAVILLQIMSVTPFFVSLSNIFGVQILLPMEKTREFNRSVQIAGVLALLVIWPATSRYGAEGAAFVSVFAEGSVVAAMAVYLYKSRIFFKSI